jgi:hypothetical protein
MHLPPGANDYVIDSGDIGYPFDGSCFLKTGLAVGTHKFTAIAQYVDENDAISKPSQDVLTVTIKKGGAKKSGASATATAPEIKAQSTADAAQKWVVIETPTFDPDIKIGAKTFVFKQTIVKRIQRDNGGRSHVIVDVLLTPDAQVILDDKQDPPVADGAFYRAIGIYVKDNETAGDKQRRVRSPRSAKVRF